MKSASGPLLALLNGGDDFQRADLWTVTLNGGQVIRWSGADIPLSFGGNTYALDPALDRGSITTKSGLEVATLDLTITAGDDDTINGVPIVQFAAGHGFDLANIQLDYGYTPDWQTPIIGTLNGFKGRVTDVKPAGNQVVMTISAWTVLMDAQMPTNLYQVGCIHTVYDSGCAILAASFSATGTVSGTPTKTAFASGLTGTAGIYAQGRVVFTSGANNGLSATVKGYDGAGNFTLIAPLPVAPAAGDTFTAIQGCDQTSPTCLTRFNNLIHFKGYPFIPSPTTAF